MFVECALTTTRDEQREKKVVAPATPSLPPCIAALAFPNLDYCCYLAFDSPGVVPG